MSAQVYPRRASSSARQRGQAIFLAAVLLLLGISAAIYTMLGSTSVSIASKQATADATTLAQVKHALIAWSAARTPSTSALIPPGLNARPGELPCPDTDNTGTDSGACSAGAIGRVPWKSLGIPEPKDSAGETLWYAIAGPFRNSNMSSAPITSDTLGTLTVYLGSSATTLTSQAIAVIFAPGAALGAQDRSSTATAACATTGTTLARNLCASNYLEATGGGNNAQTGGPFIVQAQFSGTFNDRGLAITNADLMPAVEQRVAREMMSILERYRIATGVYPWADLADGNSNASSGNYYNRDRFPCGNALPTSWPDAGITLPNWLTNGCGTCTTVPGSAWGWACIIYYAVAKNRLDDGGSDCSICATSTITCGTTTTSTDTLTITNASGRPADLCRAGSNPFSCAPTALTAGSADLVLITPGSASSIRASGWPTSFSTITGYFEDSQNSDNDVYNCYTVPTWASYDRDRIYVVR